jgi:hypothetical protein
VWIAQTSVAAATQRTKRRFICNTPTPEDAFEED